MMKAEYKMWDTKQAVAFYCDSLTHSQRWNAVNTNAVFLSCRRGRQAAVTITIQRNQINQAVNQVSKLFVGTVMILRLMEKSADDCVAPRTANINTNGDI